MLLYKTRFSFCFVLPCFSFLCFSSFELLFFRAISCPTGFCGAGSPMISRYPPNIHLQQGFGALDEAMDGNDGVDC